MDVDDLDDGIKPKNDRQREDDYLVQLIPSRERCAALLLGLR